MLMGYLYSRVKNNANASSMPLGKTEIDQVRNEIAQLRNELQRMATANEAIWEIVSQRLQVTEAELMAAVDNVEKHHAEKAQQGAPICPSCQRPTSLNQTRCIYCGHDLGPRAPFQ